MYDQHFYFVSLNRSRCRNINFKQPINSLSLSEFSSPLFLSICMGRNLCFSAISFLYKYALCCYGVYVVNDIKIREINDFFPDAERKLSYEYEELM